MSDDVWTIKAALDWTAGYLERKGDESPLVSAQWLLSEATGLSRIELYVNFDRPLSPGEREVLRDYVARRGKGEPLQYITGEVGFRHITLKVRPGVLIPRPETEVLVSEVLAALPQANRPRSAEFLAELAGIFDDEEAGAPSVAEQRPGLSARPCDAQDELYEAEDKEALEHEAEACTSSAESGLTAELESEEQQLLVADICTGSGCIACSLAYEHPAVRVIATDIAPEAVALARENVSELGLAERVRVLQGDLGFCIPSRFIGRFDAVVSNPPYVPTAVLDDIPREVADFEPTLALDGGPDGLDLFRRLLVWAAQALKPGGFFACELHETCLDAAAEAARGEGFLNVRIVYDLAGRPRVLTCERPALS